MLSTHSMVDIAGNYQKIIDRIGEAAAKSGRDARQIRLLAASKAQSVDLICAAVDAGVNLVGENYVQEAAQKKPQVVAAIEWHMIGHLQRNKAKTAVMLFDVFESLDNVFLARELDKQGRMHGRLIRAFIEVNLGEEKSKSGIAPSDMSALLQEISQLSHLRIEGLMTVPPFRENPEEIRPYFRALRELKEKVDALSIPHVDPRELSMGMSHDYMIAIEEGATIVRIGSALFGARTK